MSGNGGAWGIAMWKDGHDFPGQNNGISLEGGDAILPFLPTDPVGCLLLPPAGLGVPTVRSGDVAFAQRDGVVQFADYYEPRQITLQVLVKNDDCPGCSSSPGVDGALVLNGEIPGRAFTPDSPAVSITGDLEVVVHLALDQWPPADEAAPVSQFVTGGDGRAWTTRINITGTVQLFWSEDGIATLNAGSSTTLPPMAAGEDLWLRYRLDVDNGAGGRDITFETSSDGQSWTQLGSTITQAGVTSIHDSSADIVVGAYNNGGSERLIGRVFYAEVRDGINGTIVANPDFSQSQGYSTFADGVGNIWTVVSPARLVPFQAPRMSARQKVSRLTQEWSRNCSGATLVIFSDCHNPDATEEEKIYLGPYLVHGRPRVADVVWERSNRGAARVTLRFDAEDARLLLAQTDEGNEWTGDQTTFLDPNENLAPDPDLSEQTMTLNGATVQDSHLDQGGPGDGPWFQRFVQSPNTTSPFAMATSGSGTSGIPVVAGQPYSFAWWAMKEPGGGQATRVDWTWYDAGGAQISPHNGAAQTATATWQRFTQENAIAPVGAAFLQVRLIWTGTAIAGQTLGFGQVWVNEGATATAADQVDVAGTLCVYPLIHLDSTMTAPIVVSYGPYQFTYNEDITTGRITVDTRYGRATDFTIDVTQNLSGDFSSPLAPGFHDVQVQTADPADTGGVTVEWANAVVSG